MMFVARSQFLRPTSRTHVAVAAACLLLAACDRSISDSIEPQSIGPAAAANAPSAPAPVASITINAGPRSVTVGGTLQLAATTRDSKGKVLTGRVITWQSSDPSVAAINSSGLVTGVVTGSAVMTATSEGKSDTARVWVYIAYSSPFNYSTTVSGTITIRDSVRNRNIPIRVRVPVGALQPLPVIFIMPGGGAALSTPSTGGTTGWGGILGATGAAVIHMSSPTYSQSAYCTDFQVPANECSNAVPSWRISRALDMTTVLNQLALVSSLAGVQLDATRVGVTGHSSGAGAVLLLAGATVDISPTVTGVSLGDSRFSAFLANSPPGAAGNTGFTSASFATITQPLLMQSGSNDFVNEQTPAIRQAVFSDMAAGDKYLAFYTSTDATHGAFDVENAPASLKAYIGRVGTAFFDAHLRGSASARSWLTTNQLLGWSSGVGSVAIK